MRCRDLTWQARAQRNGGPDDGWQTRDEYRDFPRSTDGRRSSRGQGDRQRNPFDSPFDSLNGVSGITEQWEQRAEEIQRDAQRTARQAVRHPTPDWPLLFAILKAQLLCLLYKFVEGGNQL